MILDWGGWVRGGVVWGGLGGKGVRWDGVGREGEGGREGGGGLTAGTLLFRSLDPVYELSIESRSLCLVIKGVVGELTFCKGERRRRRRCRRRIWSLPRSHTAI